MKKQPGNRVGNMKRIIHLCALAALLLVAVPSGGQNITLSTNLLDWANFGTVNGSASFSVSRRVSLGVNAEYNPWTFGVKSGDWVYNRHRTFGATVDVWPWYVNAGWSLMFGAQWKEYAMGGLPWPKHDYGERFGRIPLTEEGRAIGAGASVKYTRLLSKHWNLELGAGLWAGKKQYTRYRCPNCGRRLEQGSKWFVAPYGVSATIVFVIPFGESRAQREALDAALRTPYRPRETR